VTKKEFALFVSALKTYYPRENILPNEQAIALWYNQLQDLPYNVAEVVLNKWVATNKWSPSIADIREQVAGLTKGESKTWGEAWDEVIRLVRRYGSYDEGQALASMDEVTRRAVKGVGWKNICFSENISVERANFRMAYEQIAEREKTDAQLPPQLRRLINNMPALIGSEPNDTMDKS
jgi:hypothetical protein